MEFTLRGPFIELDNLLKTVGAAPDGAAAKAMIREGVVRVNGQPEVRVRRKLRTGDRVFFQDREIVLA